MRDFMRKHVKPGDDEAGRSGVREEVMGSHVT